MILTFLRAAAFVAVVLLATRSGDAHAQSPPDPSYEREQIFDSYQAFKDRLAEISNVADAAERTSQLNALWSQLQHAGQVPYAQEGQVAFLHRGSASSVRWAGDFNGWNPSSNGWSGVKLPNLDLWILEKSFPEDARLDYKIVTNGSTWILDPANPLQMWSGLGGPNSELRMPTYSYPQETVRDASKPRGTLGGNVRINSPRLGYGVNYRVYTPPGYAAENLDNLPVVYVTDGHEYSADYLGSMVVVLDNLIAAGAIQPTMAVFIDPRDPNNPSNNRRGTEYTQNANFLGFVADELVPAVDGGFRTLDSPSGRTILGTSLGGVNSAYFGAARSDVFENIAVQSPASFSSYGPQVLNLYATQPLQEKLDIYLTAGTIGDGNAGPAFAAVLDAHGYDYTFKQVNEGHSWGNWRALLDDILVNLVGPTATLGGDFNEDGVVDAADLAVLEASFGSMNASHADGDANSDRVVDGTDLLVWQRQAAAAAAASSLTGGVPEPASAALSCGAAVALQRLRRR